MWSTNLSHELRTLIAWTHLKVWWNQCISARWKQRTLPNRHSICLPAKVAQVHARWLALVMVWKCRMGRICSLYRFLTGLLHHSGGTTDQFYLFGYSSWLANIHQGVLDMNPVTSSLLPVTQHFPEGSFYASKCSPLQTTLALLCSLLTQMLTWLFHSFAIQPGQWPWKAMMGGKALSLLSKILKK